MATKEELEEKAESCDTSEDYVGVALEINAEHVEDFAFVPVRRPPNTGDRRQ